MLRGMDASERNLVLHFSHGWHWNPVPLSW